MEPGLMLSALSVSPHTPPTFFNIPPDADLDVDLRISRYDIQPESAALHLLVYIISFLENLGSVRGRSPACLYDGRLEVMMPAFLGKEERPEKKEKNRLVKKTDREDNNHTRKTKKRRQKQNERADKKRGKTTTRARQEQKQKEQKIKNKNQSNRKLT